MDSSHTMLLRHSTLDNNNSSSSIPVWYPHQLVAPEVPSTLLFHIHLHQELASMALSVPLIAPPRLEACPPRWVHLYISTALPLHPPQQQCSLGMVWVLPLRWRQQLMVKEAQPKTQSTNTMTKATRLL